MIINGSTMIVGGEIGVSTALATTPSSSASVPTASSAHVEEIALCRRQLAEKEAKQAELLDKMMMPSDPDCPLDKIIEQVTKINIEMEDVKKRLAAALKAPTSMWGGVAGSGGANAVVGGNGVLSGGEMNSAIGAGSMPAMAASSNFHPYSPFAPTAAFPPVVPSMFAPIGSGAPIPTNLFGAASAGSLFPPASSSAQLLQGHTLFSGFGSGFAPSLHPHQQLRPPLISPTSTTSSVESVSAPGFGSAFHNDNNILNGFGAIGAAPASSSFSSTSSIASAAAAAAAASAPPPITASLTGGPLIKDVGGVT